MYAHNEGFTVEQPTSSGTAVAVPQDSNVQQYVRVIAGLGALGVALQNYPAVVLFINGLTSGLPASRLLSWSTQVAALTTGGLCSGMVNCWMNIGLLHDFYERMTSGKKYKYHDLKGWERLQFLVGIFVFVVTGLLFGLMAFTFAMTGPLAILSIAAGIFVAAIMTIQEVETWLKSYEKEAVVEDPLTNLQLLGKWIGHIIAVGNVLALSLLFTLGLAQALIAVHMAAFPALMIGLSVAFTFGAFTEYFFYNYYLSNFCKKFGENLGEMMNIPNAWFGFLCVTTNALVNGALTYAGVELLTGLLLAANIALPPMLAITVLAAVSAFFAGSASFILGLDFWISQSKEATPTAPTLEAVKTTPNASIAHRRYGAFPAAANDDYASTASGYVSNIAGFN